MTEEKNGCFCFHKTGALHKQLGMECEDRAACGTVNEMKYVALADGAGSRKCAAQGAEYAIKGIVEYVAFNFERILEMSEEKASYLITNHILYILQKHSDNDKISEYGSTLLFYGVKNGKYIMYHLGDGIIVGKKNNRHKVISWPMNGVNRRYTFLTTTEDAHMYARFSYGENLYDSVLLSSDGCDECVIERHIRVNRNVAEILEQPCKKERLLQFIEKNEIPKDDYSVSFMKI